MSWGDGVPNPFEEDQRRRFEAVLEECGKYRLRILVLEAAMEKAIRECRNNERGTAIGTLQLALEGKTGL